MGRFILAPHEARYIPHATQGLAVDCGTLPRQPQAHSNPAHDHRHGLLDLIVVHRSATAWAPPVLVSVQAVQPFQLVTLPPFNRFSAQSRVSVKKKLGGQGYATGCICSPTGHRSGAIDAETGCLSGSHTALQLLAES
jgi:hypothetical protein